MCGCESGEIASDHDVAVGDAAAERELRPEPADLLAAALAPGAREPAARLVEVQREAAGVEPQQREPARVLLAGGDLLQRDARRDRADRAVVAVRVPGVVQEEPGRLRVLLQDRLHLRGIERVARRDRERRLLHDQRVVAEHDRRLRRDARRARCGTSRAARPTSAPAIAAVAGLVVGVDPEHAQAARASRRKYVGSSPGKNWSWKQSLPCHCPTRHDAYAAPTWARSWLPRVTK